jgi:hypothetical protein
MIAGRSKAINVPVEEGVKWSEIRGGDTGDVS